MLRQTPYRIYDQKEARNPLTTDTPPRVPWVWLNTLSGELFCCIDNTSGASKWNGNLGTKVR